MIYANGVRVGDFERIEPLSGTLTVAGNLTVTGSATVDVNQTVTGAVDITGDLTVRGGDIIAATATTWNVLNTVATTVNAFGAATTIALGAATGTFTIANATVALTGATAFNCTPPATFTGDVAVNGGDLTSTATTFNLLNTPTTLNIGGAATAISIGAATGTLTLANPAVNFALAATIPTLYGSTAANGDLTLEGTSSATKTTSYVILQPTGGNVGIGTTGPDTTLVLSQSTQYAGLNFFNSNASYSNLTSGRAAPTNNADFTGSLGLYSATNGGLILQGQSDADQVGVVIMGIIGASNPVDTTPAISLDGYKWDGATGLAALGDAETIIQIANGGTGRVVVLGNGNVGISTTVPQSLLDVQGPVGTGATCAGILTLATKELTIVDDDQLGRINFNAPLESDGTDAILAGAAIWAEAEATFSATVNNTALVFGTATTSAAIERMRIDASGSVIISGTGPHAIGGAVSAQIQLWVQGAFTGAAAAYGLYVDTALTPAANGLGVGTYIKPTFVEAGSGTHSLFAGLYLDISPVTVGVAAVTNTASLYIAGAMSATVTGANYAVWVDAGTTRLDGDLDHDGSNIGFYGVAPAARSSAYTPTNVTTDRGYDANVTSLDEIADVLGTLIADLQLIGIIG